MSTGSGQNSELRTCLFDPSKCIVYIDIICKWHYPPNYSKYGSGKLPPRRKMLHSLLDQSLSSHSTHACSDWWQYTESGIFGWHAQYYVHIILTLYKTVVLMKEQYLQILTLFSHMYSLLAQLFCTGLQSGVFLYLKLVRNFCAIHPLLTLANLIESLIYVPLDLIDPSFCRKKHIVSKIFSSVYKWT